MGRTMKTSLLLLTVAGVAALGLSAPAGAQPRTFVYSVVHSRYGDVGAYQRTIDESGGTTRARSRLTVAVKMMGMVVHREQDDQTEVWRDGRLISFTSVSDTQGQRLTVSGQASGGRFEITTPSGVVYAPADVFAADPWGLNHVGKGEAVLIKSGKVDHVVVSGGGTEQVTVGGVTLAARHFSASTDTQPDKWDVWIDQAGVPVKFRSREGSATVDFSLTSPPPGADGALAQAQHGDGG